MIQAHSTHPTACPICGDDGRYAFTGTDLLLDRPGKYRYNQCVTCGSVYQDPAPTPEEISSFYPAEYEPYRPERGKKPGVLKKAVLRDTFGYSHLHSRAPRWLGRLAGLSLYADSIPFRTDGNLLDVGCGGGKYIRSMQILGWEVEGVEFNPSAVQACRETGLKVFQGELSDAQLGDETFDVVTARHVIEHIPDPKPFVGEIFRILKPGGLMILKTPNNQALARRWFGTNWYANDVPRHLVLFSPSSLKLLAQRYGFQTQKIETFSSPKIILNSWDYLITNTGKPSKKRKLRRLLARIYVMAAAATGHGDEIFGIFKKPVVQ